jgi:hypothetical protein
MAEPVLTTFFVATIRWKNKKRLGHTGMTEAFPDSLNRAIDEPKWRPTLRR